jgi:hypothetical protein
MRPHKLTTTACIEAPSDTVWSHLARLDQIHLWTDAIHRAYLTSACATGVGAERACDLGHNRSLHERVIAWNEGVSYTYESTDAPMMTLARNRWTVHPVGPNRTLVTSEAEVVFRGGWFGWLAGWLLIPLMSVVLPNPLAKLKYWVESGRPFEGSARRLRIPVASC